MTHLGGYRPNGPPVRRRRFRGSRPWGNAPRTDGPENRVAPEQWPPRKEDAACCRAKALPDGRPVIGFCGADCERRRR